jgi:hypothetical protein
LHDNASDRNTGIELASAIPTLVASITVRAIAGLAGGIVIFKVAVVLVVLQSDFQFHVALATAFTIPASQNAMVAMVSMLLLGKSGSGVRSLILRLREFNENN